MDLTKIKSERISVSAKGRVVEKFFPNSTFDEILDDNNLSSKAQDMHSGALCLYAATLLTKVYETNTEELCADSTDRQIALETLIKSSPKFSSFSDDQISTIAKEMILKDIRNSFAHGNFEISYDIYTKKLNFILKPRRKDFITDTPIIISKNALFKANRRFVANSGTPFFNLSKEETEQRIVNRFGENLKKLILPAKMLKLSEHYLENPEKFAKPLELNSIDYGFIQYLLSATRITYEQDDYYKIFGKNSNIFSKIAFIRNSIAHDSFVFDNNISTISYTDRTETLDESLNKTTSSLVLANIQKDLIMERLKKGNTSEESIKSLAEVLDNIFNAITTNLDSPDFINEDE